MLYRKCLFSSNRRRTRSRCQCRRCLNCHTAPFHPAWTSRHCTDPLGLASLPTWPAGGGGRWWQLASRSRKLGNCGSRQESRPLRPLVVVGALPDFASNVSETTRRRPCQQHQDDVSCSDENWKHLRFAVGDTSRGAEIPGSRVSLRVSRAWRLREPQLPGNSARHWNRVNWEVYLSRTSIVVAVNKLVLYCTRRNRVSLARC